MKLKNLNSVFLFACFMFAHTFLCKAQTGLVIDEAALLGGLPESVKEVEAAAIEGAEAEAEDVAAALAAEDEKLSGMSLEELQSASKVEVAPGETPVGDIAIDEDDLAAIGDADELADMSMEELRKEAFGEAGMDSDVEGLTGMGATTDLALMGAGGGTALGLVGVFKEIVSRVMDRRQLKMMLGRANMMAGQTAMGYAMGGGGMMGGGMGMQSHMGMDGGMGMLGGITGVKTSRYGLGGDMGGGSIFSRRPRSLDAGFQKPVRY